MPHFVVERVASRQHQHRHLFVLLADEAQETEAQETAAEETEAELDHFAMEDEEDDDEGV